MRERTVIHLQLIATNEHYYFGSLRALCDKFDTNAIGISYNALRNKPPKPGEPYRNKMCIIRKGTLEAKSTNRGPKPKSKSDEDANN